MDKESLREILREISENNHQPASGEQAYELLPYLLEYLGDPDPELRDDLIYENLARWIIREDYYSVAVLSSIAEVLLDDAHMFRDIGKSGDDSVYMRSFSLLMMSALLERHVDRPFLAAELFGRIRAEVFHSFEQERDLRGYTERGWAHTTAHGADAIAELVRSPGFDPSHADEVLRIIKGKLHNGIHIFQHEEADRLARPVIALLTEGRIGPDRFISWMESLDGFPEGTAGLERYTCRINSKQFARAVYFNLAYAGDPDGGEFLRRLLSAEKRLNPYTG